MCECVCAGVPVQGREGLVRLHAFHARQVVGRIATFPRDPPALSFSASSLSS